MIRRMRWWDLPQVQAIEEEAFGVTAWTPAQFWAELARVGESRWYIVDERSAAIAGYAGLFLAAGEADVQTIATAASWRGTGVAKGLLAELVDWCRRDSVSRIHLEVRADNDPAITLYRKSGFHPDGRRRDYYGHGVDAQLMTLVVP